MIQETSSASFIIIMTIAMTLLTGVIIALIYIYTEKQLKNIKELKNIGLQTKEITCKYISREIHDDVIQKLSSSLLILRRITPQDYNTREMLFHSINDLSKSLQSLHDISVMLSKNRISSKSLIDQIEEEVKKLKILKFNIEFDVFGKIQPVNVKIEEAIIRIIQESFGNIRKHSGAKKIKFTIAYDVFQLDLFISDDGKGFDTEKESQGNGLKNIKERVQELEGFIIVSSLPDYGTGIHLQIPINYE
jgi:signal transduction histidine kinase